MLGPVSFTNQHFLLVRLSLPKSLLFHTSNNSWASSPQGAVASSRTNPLMNFEDKTPPPKKKSVITVCFDRVISRLDITVVPVHALLLFKTFPYTFIFGIYALSYFNFFFLN